MALIQKLINLDNLFQQVNRKIILNDMTLADENIKDIIYTSAGEHVSLIPQCTCGELTGGYMIGKVCNACGTDVVKPFDNIDPLLWIRKFDDDIPWINPKFWLMLTNIISTTMDGLRWLSDTTYKPKKVPPILISISEILGGRSYLNVINNIEKIILILKATPSYKTIPKATKLNLIHKLYKREKKTLFSSYIPLINKNLFINETSPTNNYSTLLLADIIDLALLAVSVSNDVKLTQKKKENSTAKIISQTADLFLKYTKELVARKEGLVRKNIYGSRTHFSFRAVITALPYNYDYDTITVPWIVGLSTFRPHLINKLLKLGWTLKKASDYIYESCYVYSKLIDDLLKELIAEAPGKGIAVMLNRNPSLGASSIQLVYIVEFIFGNNTMGISKLIAKGFNADYDGGKRY